MMVETLMWIVVYVVLVGIGYFAGVARTVFNRNDMQAKIEMVKAERDYWMNCASDETALRIQTTDELLELQEDYQGLYRREQRLRDAVKAHRAANDTHCTELSCPRGCGHDVLLYEVLDATDASVAGLLPTLNVNHRRGIFYGGHESIWDRVREELPESDGELPGMWERADFEGGQEHEVRGPDWTPEEGS